MEWVTGIFNYDPTRFYQDPSTMADDELEREYRVIDRAKKEILAVDEVSPLAKQLTREHIFEVEQERRKRAGEDWLYPLSSFGIVDFL